MTPNPPTTVNSRLSFPSRNTIEKYIRLNREGAYIYTVGIKKGPSINYIIPKGGGVSAKFC